MPPTSVAAAMMTAAVMRPNVLLLICKLPNSACPCSAWRLLPGILPEKRGRETAAAAARAGAACSGRDGPATRERPRRHEDAAGARMRAGSLTEVDAAVHAALHHEQGGLKPREERGARGVGRPRRVAVVGLVRGVVHG